MKYTVVVLRPAYICDKTGEDFGKDTYVALVEADGTRAAVELAQAEAFARDQRTELEPRRPQDYSLCIMFEGHHEPTLYGWQDD